MPISADWNPQTRIWTLTTGDEFDLVEIFELVDQTDWKGGKRFLWDLRGLKRGPDSTGEIRRAAGFVERTQEQWAGGRLAVLVHREFDFGIARVFGAFAAQIDMDYEVYRDEPSAIDFLAGD